MGRLPAVPRTPSISRCNAELCLKLARSMQRSLPTMLWALAVDKRLAGRRRWAFTRERAHHLVWLPVLRAH